MCSVYGRRGAGRHDRPDSADQKLNPAVTGAGKSNLSRFATAASMIVVALGAAMVFASSTSTRVLGQFDFEHSAANLVDAKGLLDPLTVAIDSSATPNRVYVADSGNNRVLGWKDAASFSNGAPADLVIGQPDFLSTACAATSAVSLCNPEGVAADGLGNLYVADFADNRVLAYKDPFVACGSFPCVGGPASLVFGQGGSFTSSTCDYQTVGIAISANDLCHPIGVAVDGAGNLYVADFSNSRVLEYSTPLTTGFTADKVFGQGGDLSAIGCNSDTSGGAPTAKDLCYPIATAVDGTGHVYVADSGNNRVVEYNSPLTTDTTADKVFGQGGNFMSDSCNFDTLDGSSTAIDLCGPAGVATDASGNLYVVDSGNNRVLEYNTPVTTDFTADTVFGEGGDFTANFCNFDTSDGSSTAVDLCDPYGAAVDASGDLYVVDSSNNRVLKYNTPWTTATANNVLGQLDFTHQSENLTDAQGLYNPEGVAIETSATPNRIYVSDYE